MIKTLKFTIPPELENEIKYYDSQNSPLTAVSNLDELERIVESRYEYMDLVNFSKKFSSGRQILDVGVGFGWTTAYLAALGHKVTCVEPSAGACRRMEEQFRRLGLAVNIVNSTGEAMTDLAKSFDFVFFNSSLHHCDNPIRVLENVWTGLLEGGLLVVVEPILEVYRTKEMYHKMIKNHPERLGHYPGYENIYTFKEYAAIFSQAKFSYIKVFPSAKYKQQPKKDTWLSPALFSAKKTFYSTVRKLIDIPFTNGVVVPILMEWGLVDAVLTAKK